MIWLGEDHFGIVGKNPEQVPSCPPGYLYCPGCDKVTKLPGIKGNFWFGKCSCGYRIVFRSIDSAIAYVNNSGILWSCGMENGKTFQTYVGDRILFPYVF